MMHLKINRRCAGSDIRNLHQWVTRLNRNRASEDARLAVIKLRLRDNLINSKAHFCLVVV